MREAFRPAPLDMLTRWSFRDLDERETVLGLPKQNLEVPSALLALRRVGRDLAALLGVAAGPHTRLAQNIAAAWICGARFPELKTVQCLDEIEVSRPCTDHLQPGGYARLQQYPSNLENAMIRAGAESVEGFFAASAGDRSGSAGPNLARHAARVFKDPHYPRRERPAQFKGKRPLRHFDCTKDECPVALPSRNAGSDARQGYLRALYLSSGLQGVRISAGLRTIVWEKLLYRWLPSWAAG